MTPLCSNPTGVGLVPAETPGGVGLTTGETAGTPGGVGWPPEGFLNSFFGINFCTCLFCYEIEVSH